MRKTRMQEAAEARAARRRAAAEEGFALAVIVAGVTVLGLGFIYAMPFTPSERALAERAAVVRPLCVTDAECEALELGEPLDFQVVTPAREVQP